MDHVSFFTPVVRNYSDGTFCQRFLHTVESTLDACLALGGKRAIILRPEKIGGQSVVKFENSSRTQAFVNLALRIALVVAAWFTSGLALVVPVVLIAAKGLFRYANSSYPILDVDTTIAGRSAYYRDHFNKIINFDYSDAEAKQYFIDIRQTQEHTRQHSFDPPIEVNGEILETIGAQFFIDLPRDGNLSINNEDIPLHGQNSLNLTRIVAEKLGCPLTHKIAGWVHQSFHSDMTAKITTYFDPIGTGFGPKQKEQRFMVRTNDSHLEIVGEVYSCIQDAVGKSQFSDAANFPGKDGIEFGFYGVYKRLSITKADLFNEDFTNLKVEQVVTKIFPTLDESKTFVEKAVAELPSNF